MEFKSLTELIQECTRALSMVPGAGVQLYGEDRITQAIQNVFRITRAGGEQQRWWPFQCKWFQKTLDGITGKVTVRFTNVQSPADIKYVYEGTAQTPLPYLGSIGNPFALGGTTSRYVEHLHGDDDPSNVAGLHLFRIWPLSATGSITLYARTWPTNLFLDPEVDIPMDWLVLMHGAVADILASDGNNPVELALAQGKFNDMFAIVKRDYDRQPLLMDPRQTMFGSDEWREADYP